MEWASAVSEASTLDRAVAECAAKIRQMLGGPPDLAVAFLSEHHENGYAQLPQLVRVALQPRHWIGCSAGGVIGGGREVERRPGFSLSAARLPGTEVSAFHLEPSFVGLTAAGSAPWREVGLPAREQSPGLLLLADPFTFDADACVRSLDRAYPEATKAGGLASGGVQPGSNALYADNCMYSAGAVGLALVGDAAIDTVVAQGCRPIGSPMFVTRCEGNLLQGLDGRPPYEVLADLYESLERRDRELFQHSLFLGIVMLPERERYGQGDFLVRNIVGADPKSGFLSIGAALRPHMVVQFHLRDAQTSHDDLESMLETYRREAPDAPSGALLFSCLGRGQHLYGRPDHDSELFRQHLGGVPLGGFFCNGEIGPVHGQTFLHGYTSSFALFRPRR